MTVITTRHSLGTNTAGVRPTLGPQAPPWKHCTPQNLITGERGCGGWVKPFPHLFPHWVLTTVVPLSETKDPQSGSRAPHTHTHSLDTVKITGQHL